MIPLLVASSGDSQQVSTGPSSVMTVTEQSAYAVTGAAGAGQQHAAEQAVYAVTGAAGAGQQHAAEQAVYVITQ